MSRNVGAFAVALGPESAELAHNVIDSDDSMFNATPAVTGNQLLFRTNRYLYCIGAK